MWANIWVINIRCVVCPFIGTVIILLLGSLEVSLSGYRHCRASIRKQCQQYIAAGYLAILVCCQVAFSALMLWLGGRKGIRPVKNMVGGWRRWALVSLDGVAPSRMVSVSASVNLLLHYKVQKLSSGTGSPGWSRKKGPWNGCGVWWSVVNNMKLLMTYVRHIHSHYRYDDKWSE